MWVFRGGGGGGGFSFLAVRLWLNARKPKKESLELIAFYCCNLSEPEHDVHNTFAQLNGTKQETKHKELGDYKEKYQENN